MTQSPPDQHWSATAHIRGDQLDVERSQTHMRPCGIHGISKIEFGIDQSAIEIEDHEISQITLRRSSVCMSARAARVACDAIFRGR